MPNPSLRKQQIADAARAVGTSPGEAIRQEELRQGYRLGTPTVPPTRQYGTTGDPLRTEDQESRVREKARAGRPLTQEDL